MSFLNFAIIVVGFFLLYRFVMPFLFPSVVHGMHVMEVPSPNKKVEESGRDGLSHSGGKDGIEPETVVVRGTGMPFVHAGHHSHARAQLRKRNADSKYNPS